MKRAILTARLSLVVLISVVFMAVSYGQTAVPDHAHVSYGSGSEEWLNIYQATNSGPNPVLKVGQRFQPVHRGSAMQMQTGWKHCPTLLNCHGNCLT
ncbi:hypothetical protein PDESU_02209 [Pontiella desulfatans]|uniref:Uncharacterized protein n=1 Tax=Pontiella desulfatans TaxID=2750659 RepID=A0A6C2U132_PONDE|nr:hypothetical protein [Pontiella desulfatans]VGO13652.1 hypothetical protein PDESU_02209 [Pontiella desulfatans]